MDAATDMESRVLAALRDLGVSYELVHIDPEFADTADFCEKYGYPLETSGNTIVVASKRGEKKYCACIVQATARLDVNHTVKRLMGVSRASFASAEETMELTGMMIGGVTAFALPPDLPVYADPNLRSQEYVILGSGSRSSKLKIAPADLGKIPGAQFIDGLAM
jgi:prolyl-tRNA editing enzyme YbaK/EbsC (Cys-tRNA(Pro) deacylase)